MVKNLFKKLFITLSSLVIYNSVLVAQNASQYGYQAASGTFVELLGGTTAPDVQDDDVLGAAIPIGFNFDYCGSTYTTIRPGSNGFMTFTGTSSSASNTSANLSSVRPHLMWLWDDLEGWYGTARYQTTGTAPNRIFTFQYKDWNWNWSASGPNITVQVKLYETSNIIEYHYRQEAQAGNPSGSSGASIGISDNVATATYLSLNNSTATATASSTTFTTNISAKPANGQIYRFLPPGPCNAATVYPASATTSLSLTTACYNSSVTASMTPVSAMPVVTSLTFQAQYSATATGPWTNVGTAQSSMTGINFNATATGFIRILTLCSGTATSFASTPVAITVNNPTLTSTTGATRCGPGTLTLSGATATGTVNWYETATSNVVLGSGNNFVTPYITSTTNFYAASAVSGGSLNNWIGTGTSTMSSGGPYYITYDANKTQFIIRASELAAMGYTAGTITSIAYDVAATGSLPLTNYTIAMKNTTSTVVTTTFETGTTPVFSSASYTPVLGANTHTLTTPFYWDGSSNLLIENCFNNTTWASSHTVRYSTTNFTSNHYHYQDGNGNFCAAPGGTNNYTSTSRPNVRIAMNLVCEGSRTPVTATVQTPASITATYDSVACNNATVALNVSSPLANYNTYNWVYIGSGTNTLFTDAAATIPYTGTSNTTIYLKTATPGLHRVVVNGLNTTNQCTNSDTFKIFVQPTAASFRITGDRDTLCLTGQSSINVAPPSYYKSNYATWSYSDDNINFTPLVVNTLPFTTPVLDSTRYYRVVLSSVNGACDTINKTIFVNKPAFLASNDGGRCGPGVVDLVATPSLGNVVKWYNTPTATLPLDIGDTFTTPFLSNTTTFYAEVGQPGSGEIQIGTQNTATSQYDEGPYNRFYYYTRSQMLYTAAEFVALGGSAGILNSVAMKCTELPDLAFNNFRVKITTVPATQTTLNSLVPDASFLNVTTIPSHMPILGWNTYNLTSPFNWNGTDNIVVQICYTSFSSYSGVGGHEYTSAPGKMYVRQEDEANINGCDYSGFWPSDYQSDYRPNMKFGFSTCNSARIPIVAHISEKPEIDLGPDFERCVNPGDVDFLNARNPGRNYEWDNGYNGQVRVIDATGRYWVAIDNNGCVGSDTINVVYKPNPISALGNDTTTCIDAPITLNAGSGALQYYWNNGATSSSIVVDRPGMYSVVITGSNGCTVTDSINVRQSGNFPSYGGIRVRNINVNTFNFSLPNASNVASVSWDFGDGSPLSYAISPTHSYANNGNYVVRLIANSSCGSSNDTTTVHIKGFTDLKDIANNDNIKLYPNPANDYVTLTMDNNVKINQVNVLTATGRLIKVLVDVNSSSIRINTEDLNSGLYYLTVETKDGVYKRKLDIIK